jgi:hypothetical protein
MLQKGFIRRLQALVEKHGHSLNPSKIRYYGADDVKLITGAAIKDNEIAPRNKHLKLLKDDLSEWEDGHNKSKKLINRILGRMTHIGSIDPRYKDKAC